MLQVMGTFCGFPDQGGVTAFFFVVHREAVSKWSILRWKRWRLQENIGKEVVFLGVGFETTAPGTAACILEAAADGIDNFSVLCC